MRHHFVRSSAGLRDPNFKNVTLLLHGDGTNGAQNNTFLDSSASNNAITTTGNVAQGSFSPYGDRWSNYFDGNTDWLKFNSSGSAVDFTGAYTIECFFWLHSNLTFKGSFSAYTGLIMNAGGGGLNGGIEVMIAATGSVSTVPSTITISTFGSASPAGLSATGLTIPLNQWHHLVAVRDSSNNTSIFLNGSRIANGIISGSYASRDVRVGGNGDSSNYQAWLPGYISNLRVVKGSSVYDPTRTSLIVPNKPLTAITNTTLLTCHSNRFADSSSNNFSVTRTGDVSVKRFSPFGPDTLYRTDRIGGSAYFDGGEFLQVANRGLKLTAGFFTAECWVYLSVYSGNFFALFDDWYWQGGHNGGWRVFIDSLGRIVMQASNGNWNNWGGTFIMSSNSVILHQWNHVAIVRGANDLINIYINGISTTTPVARKELNLNSGSAQSAWQSRIGISASDIVFGGVYNYSFTGTISDLRIINGKCLYTANFTPPTEPLTAIPETTFLGRFTNGSIVDNAMMSSLETAGTARISTSQKKYGTGSLEISGNGLNFINTPNFRFGTGDFTLEFWLWRSSGVNMNTRMVISCWTTNGWGILFDGSQQISFSIPSGGSLANVVRDPSTFPSNEWVHVAVSRQTGTSRLFINGALVASAADANNYVATATVRIGTLDGANWNFVGYLDDFRITKGVARYTANFTPPTAPLPDF